MNPVRLMLVDDQELVRTGFAMVLDSCDDLAVVAQAGDGEAALAELDRTEVDVVLMDVGLKDVNGIALGAEMLAARPAIKLLMFSMYDNPDNPDNM